MAKTPDSESMKEAYARIVAKRAAKRRVDCPDPEELLAIIENRIEPARRLEVLDHVSGCAHCLREFKLLQSVVEGRRALD